jgi:hypothetical protein
MDIRLGAGAVNLVLDNSQILTKRNGVAQVHIPDLTAATHACIEAVDSAGNVGSYCIDRSPGILDTFPPVIVQNPVVSPIKVITGTITETRPNDRGIKNAAIEAAPNLGTPTINYLSAQQATFTVPIVDSLQPVRAWISASDSVGNASLDTLRYDPQPDHMSPMCSVDASVSDLRTFRATEFSPWDRGIASITIVGAPVNFTAGPVTFVSRFDARQVFTVIDPMKPASVVMQATDSAGNQCFTTITVNALEIPLVPFNVQSSIDFLTHLAPFDSTADIVITNPNEVPVALTKISQGGDAAVITSDLASPLVFQSLEKKTVHVRLKSALLGNWKSDFTLGNDTLTLAHITAFGTTTGAVTLGIGTVHSAHSQLPENLRVTIAAQPIPINLDTIQFELHFNGDLISASQANIDCSTANALCNYQFKQSSLSNGVLQFQFVRTDKSQLATLSGGSAYFDIPFTTFVTKTNTSLVFGDNMSASLSSVVSDTGTVSVGDLCGDPAIRAYMNDQLEAYVSSIVPNPASSQADIVIVSSKQDLPISLVLVDQLGKLVLKKDAVLLSGSNTIQLPLTNVSSGRYILGLTSGGGEAMSLPLEVVR